MMGMSSRRWRFSDTPCNIDFARCVAVLRGCAWDTGKSELSDVKVLISNDDGIHSPGLWQVARALAPLAQVFVCAPDREQSGVGTCLTLHAPIRANQVTPQVEGVTAYSVEGTPGDSVILALEHLVGPVDLVISGINSGSNMGEDVLVSGTVGAALQGYVRGYNAIAISVTALSPHHYGPATGLLRSLATRLTSDSLPKPLFLNINLPDQPADRLAGVEITRMGQRSYTEVVKEGEDGKRKWYWIARSKPVLHEEEGSDVSAVARQCVSITPLHTVLTADEALPALRGLQAELAQALAAASPA